MAGYWLYSSELSKAAANGIINDLAECYYIINDRARTASIAAVAEYVEDTLNWVVNCTVTIPTQTSEGMLTMIQAYNHDNNRIFQYNDNIPIPAGDTPTVVNFRISVNQLVN